MSAPAAHPTVEHSAEDILNAALKEMSSAWKGGRQAGAEEYLAQYPVLRNDPETAVRLIYEEICLRQEAGEANASSQVVARFPEFRTDLEVFLECYRLLGPAEGEPDFPSVNQWLGEFWLLQELGRGTCGRVFIATQPELADRPVVLKLTAGEEAEHLSLARLQHAPIVPLYLALDFPDRHLQGLCMPYLGGLTLADL